MMNFMICLYTFYDEKNIPFVYWHSANMSVFFIENEKLIREIYEDLFLNIINCFHIAWRKIFLLISFLYVFFIFIKNKSKYDNFFVGFKK